MNKPSLKLIAKNAKREFIRQSPNILLGVGITGMITSTVMAVKATPKALKLIEEERNARKQPETVYHDNTPLTVVDMAPELTKLEIVKIAWKPYIPSITVGGLSLLCILGSTSINAKRTAGLAAAYKLSEAALTEYKDAVVETIGTKKEKEVREKIADKQVEANPVNNSTVILTSNGNTLCYDPLSGRYFRSSPEAIYKAVNDVNFQLLNEEFVSLNEFYDNIGLELTKLGENLGWNSFREGKVEVDFNATLTPDKEPCLVMDFKTDPRYDYWKLEY